MNAPQIDLEATETMRVRALVWGWVALGYTGLAGLLMWLCRHTGYAAIWGLPMLLGVLGTFYYFGRAIHIQAAMTRVEAQEWREEQ